MGLSWATFRININSNRKEFIGIQWGAAGALIGNTQSSSGICALSTSQLICLRTNVCETQALHTSRCVSSACLLRKKSRGRKCGKEIKREEKDWKSDFKCLWIAISQCVGRWCRGDILSIFILWTALLHSWLERMRWEYCEISVRFQWLHIWYVDQSSWSCNFSYNFTINILDKIRRAFLIPSGEWECPRTKANRPPIQNDQK